MNTHQRLRINDLHRCRRSSIPNILGMKIGYTMYMLYENDTYHTCTYVLHRHVAVMRIIEVANGRPFTNVKNQYNKIPVVTAAVVSDTSRM